MTDRSITEARCLSCSNPIKQTEQWTVTEYNLDGVKSGAPFCEVCTQENKIMVPLFSYCCIRCNKSLTSKMITIEVKINPCGSIMVFGCTYACLDGYYRHGRRTFGLRHKCTNCDEVMTGTEYKCSLCKYTRYCSSACQKADWKTHKKKCKEMCEDKTKEKQAGV